LAGGLEDDESGFDGVDFFGVGVFGVEGCDFPEGFGPPIKVLARGSKENCGYLTYSNISLDKFVE